MSRAAFPCLLALLAGTPAFADTPLDTSSTQAATTSTISGKVSDLLNEKYVPPAGQPPVTPAPPQAATPHVTPSDTPRSVTEAEERITIQSNVSKLYGERLPSGTLNGTQRASDGFTPALPSSEISQLPSVRAASQNGQPLTPPQLPGAATAQPASPLTIGGRALSSNPQTVPDVPVTENASDDQGLPPYMRKKAPSQKTKDQTAGTTEGTGSLVTATGGAAAVTATSFGAAATPLAAGGAGTAAAAGANLSSGASGLLTIGASTSAANAVATAASTNATAPSLGLASQAAISAPAPNTSAATLSNTAPTSSPQSSLSLNSPGATNPYAPKTVPPVNSSAISMEAIKTDNWNTTDTAITAPSSAAQIEADQKNALAGPALAKEAAAASSISGVSYEAAGNASDVPDAAFIRNLAGTNGIIALDVASVASPSRADREVQIAKPVHIDEAVAFALKNNFEVLASNEKINSAHWDKMGAYAQYGPTAEYDIDGGSERSEPAAINDANGNRVLDNTHHRRDTNISVRQPLIDLGVISDILSARDKEDAVKADSRDTREGIASDTINVFLKLVQARIAVRLADQYKAYLDNLAQRMTARVEGGGGTSADLDRIHSRSELAYSARIEALGEYETDLSEFKRLTKVLPSEIQIPDLLAPAVPDSIDQALDHAVRANPAYASSLSKIDAAGDDRNKAFAGLLPKLSVQYNKSSNFDAGGSAEGDPVDGVYPNQKQETVLLVAQWVLGGTSITTGLSGAAKEREARLQSQDVLDRMEQAVRSSYTAINAARQRRSVLQKTVAANERVVKGFEDQYKDGNRSLFDLLDSYEQLYSSRLNLMRVVIANAQASYQIRREMGELVPSIMGAEQR